MIADDCTVPASGCIERQATRESDLYRVDPEVGDSPVSRAAWLSEVE
jgi:hypothetical protein